MGKIRDKLSYLFGLAKKHGVVGLGMKYIEKKTEKTDQYYRRHYEDFLPTEEELQKQRKSWRDFSYWPKNIPDTGIIFKGTSGFCNRAVL